MWVAIVIVCGGIGLAITLRQFRYVQDYPTRLLLLAFWARLSVSALPEYTAKSLVAGFSLIALTTLGLTFLLLTTCRQRDFQDRRFAVYLPLIAIMLVSSAFNGAVKGLVAELIAWTIFAVTLQATRQSIAVNGMDRAMRALMAPFLTPLLLQLASIAVNKSIGSEEDGSRGFVGGYIHESVFSRFAMTFLVLALLVRWRSAWTRFALLLYSVFSIFVSNYRTTILAVLPIAGVAMAGPALAAFRARYRPAVLLGAAALAAVVVVVALPLLPPRYSQIFDAAAQIENLIQRPIEYTREERKLFSARLFIWSMYISEYSQGNVFQLLFGLGSYADQGKFFVNHAHNSYVQYLYEYGLIGLAYLFFLIFYNFWFCLSIRDGHDRALMISIHLSFIVLNLSTGVLKSIEGLQLYALIMAATLARAQPRPAFYPAVQRPG